jgi:hypothetical protein
MLPSVFGDRVLAIDDSVYAMWELPPADYLLHAFSASGYLDAYLAQTQGKLGAGMGAHRTLTCVSGSDLLIAVADVGVGHTLTLKDLDSPNGMEYVRNALRSGGVYSGAPGYRDCELKW